MLLKLRPARIEDVVNGEKLRVQLTAAALDNLNDADAARKRALDLLHGALFRGRMIAAERLQDGARGLETAELLCKVADEVIRALYDFTTTHMFRARNPTEGERFAILAVGGYGRGRLWPSSDIDLLFLRAYKQTPWTESVTEYMLYMLWDMSLKVGHASRTIPETLKLAREDHTVQTALLEARLLCGDPALFGQFQSRFATEVMAPTRRDFIAAKLRERDERHVRAGSTRYLVEPNVKEGKGGLRDLDTIGWIGRHKWDARSPDDFERLGVLTQEETGLFRRALEFLARVRCHLHFLTGRAEERLTFDLQPELARRMGYRESEARPPVERFMRRYFLAAKDVGALTRVLAAKLEADQDKKPPLMAGLFQRRGETAEPSAPFRIEGERLDAPPEAFDADPVNLLRVFGEADRLGVDLHPRAMREVTRRLKKITAAVRADPEAQRAFLDVAASANNPAGTLRLMNEAGVLGRFVPEFGRVVAQMQFNMYHHYTVDEHTLRAVEVISDIEHGRCKSEHPLATAIFPKIVHRRALYLAMLLHDTGKGKGDQQEEGALAAREACARLGLPEDEIELVAWLVRRHLLMSEVAQRRDLSDPSTIANFVKTVGALERMRLLLILTVADIRAVGPTVWNAWKGQLLRDLYALAEAVFRGGRTDEASVQARLDAQAAQIKQTFLAEAGPLPPQAHWLAELEGPYWLSFDRDALNWHLQAATVANGSGAYVAARPAPDRHVTELLVRAPDRPGLFAALAGALALSGADVSDARVNTSRDGYALDVFSILDSEGNAFGASDPDVLARLTARVKAAAEGAEPSVPPRRPPMRRAAAFAIEPWAVVDNTISRSSTVIEVSGRDRPGLLAALAAALAEAKVSVNSAHIDAYGERVSDVFYVTDLEGAKLSDPDRIEALKALLVSILQEEEPDAPVDPAKRKLAVAPASHAR